MNAPLASASPQAARLPLECALDLLPVGCPAVITEVAWGILAPDEAHRLRALGIDVGAQIRVAHRGVLGGADPLAIEVGRMTVALRRVHAQAMRVTSMSGHA